MEARREEAFSMQYTEYQGVNVIDVQPEVRCRHPRWGYDEKKMYKLKETSLLLLEDGTLLVVCDDCGFNGLTGNDPYVKPVSDDYKSVLKQADSVLAHKSSVHWRKLGRPPVYTEDEIKAFVKIWLKWRAIKIKNWSQRAADDLNRLGFKPANSESWNAGSLGALVRNYINKEPFKNLKAASMSDEEKSLADMIRTSAENANGTTTVARNARITTTQKPKRHTHTHTPVDFAAIIADKEAAGEQQEKEEPVSPTPILSFDPNEVDSVSAKAIVIEPKPAPEPVPVIDPAPQQNDDGYKHIATLEDGSPLFTYKNKLMVGKAVKGIET